MELKSLVKEMGYKLRKLRESLRMRPSEMARRLELDKTTYMRYENCANAPALKTLCQLGLEYGFSLDWYILNRGPQYYEEIKNKLKIAEEVKKEPEPTLLDRLPADVIELLEYMECVPSFRYEVLLFFHRYKEEREEKTVVGAKG